MPGSPRRVLSEEKVRDISQFLRSHPEAQASDLKDRFQIGRTKAYELLKEFSSALDLKPRTQFCVLPLSLRWTILDDTCCVAGRRSGTPVKTHAMLYLLIRRVLDRDCTLTVRGIRRMLRLLYDVKVGRSLVYTSLHKLGPPTRGSASALMRGTPRR